jgi:YVTN family beta-propeller protein
MLKSHRFNPQRFTETTLGLITLFLLIGCSANPGVTTTSQVTMQMANVRKTVNDPTAVTSVNLGTTIAEGCVANGGTKPPIPPPGTNWAKIETSPGAGQCHFSDLQPQHTYSFDYFSGKCAATLGTPDLPQIQTADRNGFVQPVNLCTIQDLALNQLDGHFARTAQFPSTVTFTTPGLSAAYGSPQLLAYGAGGNLVGSSIATSVAADGSSATFPFPMSSSGSTLPGGMYMFAVQNYASNGSFKVADATHYTVGTDMTMNTPFGIDAVDIRTDFSTCFRLRCIHNTTTTPTPLITIYSANQLSYQGALISVGTRPVAVKAFRITTVDIIDTDTTSRIRTGPSLALVVNEGSDNVSVVDLNQNTVAGTVAVGSQPMAILVKPDETKAYVANFGSGSITEIDLSTFTATRALQVGTNPMSLAMDPGGTALWIGGQGYAAKIDLSSFAIISNIAVNGAVTSLASSVQLNELVGSVVGNTNASSTAPYSPDIASTSNYVIAELNLNTMAVAGSYAPASASSYASYSMNGTLPNAAAIPGAAQISQQWNNGMGISATPAGFVVYDLTNHAEIMRGTTPTPIRGIASDPNNWVVYLTLPDSNDLITIPLPH